MAWPVTTGELVLPDLPTLRTFFLGKAITFCPPGKPLCGPRVGRRTVVTSMKNSRQGRSIEMEPITVIYTGHGTWKFDSHLVSYRSGELGTNITTPPLSPYRRLQ